MSFGDINRSQAARASKPVDAVTSQFSESLQNFQKIIFSLRDKTTELRHKSSVTNNEKDDVERRIREVKASEAMLKTQLDAELKHLDQLPRTAVVHKRITLGKLQKDFDRIRAALGPLINEASLIKTTTGENESKPQEASNLSSTGQKIAGPRLIQTLQGQEVDTAIMEERERDLRKINQDLALVNEMFRDMAEIVDKQGVMIEDIAVTTEVSHERAKAGLEQVQKAASSQSSCILS